MENPKNHASMPPVATQLESAKKFGLTKIEFSAQGTAAFQRKVSRMPARGTAVNLLVNFHLYRFYRESSNSTALLLRMATKAASGNVILYSPPAADAGIPARMNQRRGLRRGSLRV